MRDLWSGHFLSNLAFCLGQTLRLQLVVDLEHGALFHESIFALTHHCIETLAVPRGIMIFFVFIARDFSRLVLKLFLLLLELAHLGWEDLQLLKSRLVTVELGNFALDKGHAAFDRRVNRGSLFFDR